MDSTLTLPVPTATRTDAMPDEATPENNAARTRIIDCDVHHQFDDPKTLFPYLPRHYVEHIQDFGSMMPTLGHTNIPGNGARHDLWVGAEVNPATCAPGGHRKASRCVRHRSCHSDRRPLRGGCASRRRLRRGLLPRLQ
ncbi:MAG: hypothetical protein HC802_03545 [Caldilineaceae bacterium]|nr:hypothetical protein [Caldilineaceae bacterium]